MRVLKVVAEGIMTSFRYPHFMQQIQPTYEMPPPATIYGHICSALGEWFDPDGVKFAYHFAYDGVVTDTEHIMVLSAAGGLLPGTRLPKIQQGNINPFKRDLLFRPRLTLYVNKPEWEPAFRSPCYAVVLGRSQDLFTYTDVQVVDLEREDRAYFEHTLAPHSMALQVMRGVTVLMPRYLDYFGGRAPVFDRYLMIRDRVMLPAADALRFDRVADDLYWVDPTTPSVDGAYRGVVFHSFKEDEE